MRAVSGIARLLCGAAIFFSGGCERLARSLYLIGCDRNIAEATRAIENAHDDAQRATAYAKRGRAYCDKARYSRMVRLIAADEFGRQFGVAVNDHDKAVLLAHDSAAAHFSRGQTYYDRATVEEPQSARPWFDLAAADFKKAFEKERSDYMALDMLGVVHMGAGDLDEAIRDFTREMAMNPLGRARLADVYCARGSAYYGAKKYDAAIADYEKSIEMVATTDDCGCDPYNPLIALYADGRQYDKGWETVHKAEKVRKWVAPESLEKLHKGSRQ